MTIREIKDQYTCLDYLGKPVKRTKNGWLYRCPWREDTHPSLSVTANGRGWHDLATGGHGSVIDLAMMCLNTHDVSVACEEIQRHTPGSFSFCPAIKNEEKEKSDTFTSFEVVKLQSRGLFAYLYKRKVNIDIAKQFLMEARYSFDKNPDGRYLYALAYANDAGGYELRSRHYKGGTSPKAITRHWLSDDAPVVIFEGFLDMLSFATLCGKVRHNYIVLNSVVNVDAAINAIAGYTGKVYLALDNDDAGRTATHRILEAIPSAEDISSRYAPYKDVNDYLCASPTK